VTVELPAGVFRRRNRDALKRSFDEEHQRRYGTCAPGEPAEIVSLRATVTGRDEKNRRSSRVARGGSAPPASARRGKRGVYFAELGRSLATPSYARDGLRAGNRIGGAGAHRGTRFDDRRVAGRPPRGGWIRQPRHRSRPENGMKRAKRRIKADAVLTEIVRNGVIAVTEEMKTNLMRTAYNMIVYEALDFNRRPVHRRGRDGVDRPGTAELYPRHGRKRSRRSSRTSGKMESSPATFSSPTTPTPRAAISTISPSACRSSTRASSPVSACCMAHWTDVGGVLGGVTTDIYSEGLQIPIVKYARAGVVNQDLVDIIRMNVRIPERAMGDLRAQITAVKTGERRFLELLDRYGREEVLAAIANIMDQSEPLRASTLAPSPTAPTKPSRSWTTTAWTSASAYRSRCAW